MTETVSQGELLPCPFCGAPASLERDSDHHGEWFNLGCSRHWGAVPNADDGCIGGRLFYTEEPENEAKAIAAWNTRAIDPRHAATARQEALEEAAKVAEEFEADRNSRAYEKRQAGQDDSFHAACASAASRIAGAIRSLSTQGNET